MSDQSFIQVPPDSSGKRLHTHQHTVNGTPVHVQGFHNIDPNNPDNVQRIDGRGQASIRFAEGSPTMDVMGSLRISDATCLGMYEYTNGDMADLFTDVLENGGTATWEPSLSSTVFSVNSSSGSKAIRTTNRYHYYQPGVGILVLLTLGHGDLGKEGNVREWGYGDNDNGVFFKLDGTQLGVLVRTSIGGTMSETFIPQSQWNGDTLDGTGISGVALDLSKVNFYWIDLAWLGSGVIRFGVYANDGSRWVCHTIQNPNSNINPYMASASLPIQYKIENTSSTSGASEFKAICAAIYAESRINYTYWRFSDVDSGAPKTVGTTAENIVSLRPSLLYGGKTNRVGIYPETLSVYVGGGSVKLTIQDDAVLQDAVWNQGAATVEYDYSGTIVEEGEKFLTFMLEPGCHNLFVGDFFERTDEGYHVLASGDGAYSMTVAAQKINPADSNVVVSAVVNYRELR